MKGRRASLIGIGVAILVVVGLVLGRAHRRPPPAPLPAMTLAAPDGHEVSLDQFRGKWVLVYFGYTHCRSDCTAPLDGMRQAAAARPDVAALFVTLDPGRDDTATLAAFTRPFAPLVTALTGTADAIAAAERNFGVYAVRRDTPRGVHYDRSNLIYVVNPKGQIAAHVDGGAPVGIISSSIGKPAT